MIQISDLISMVLNAIVSGTLHENLFKAQLKYYIPYLNYTGNHHDTK